MVLIDGVYSTPVYSLKESYSVKDGNSSFFIDYTSREGVLLDIYQGDKKISDINLPGSNSNIHYQIPVLQGDKIEGFRIKSLSNGETAGSFRLLNAGVEKVMPGFKVKKISDSLELIIKDGFIITDSSSFSFDRLSAEADRDFNQVQVSVDYDYTGSSKKEYELVIYSKDHEKRFELNARRGGSTIYFYSDSLGFVPSGIKFESTDSAFMVTGIGISSFSKNAHSDYS
ncbi:MAG: hypothetical protein L3J12_10770, partial [Spirochaetales bacterium]|nr:hypothetical protein [Spirochaetales bacterium]